MTPPLKYPWDSSAFEQPSLIRDYTKPLDFSAPAPLDMTSLMGTAAKYGPTSSFIPGTPIGDTYSYMGGDAYMPAAIPMPQSSSWFSGIDSTMKNIGKTLQDWGVTGGKNPDGSTFNGWGGLALGAAQGIANWMTGKEQLALQKRAVNSSIKFAEENLAMQKSRVNGDLRDRQAARVASNPGAYQSVGDYMKQNGVA